MLRRLPDTAAATTVVPMPLVEACCSAAWNTAWFASRTATAKRVVVAEKPVSYPAVGFSQPVTSPLKSGECPLELQAGSAAARRQYSIIASAPILLATSPAA